jgi:DMSO/TMAO reductase YedYZ heme-binding membrane subunit
MTNFLAFLRAVPMLAFMLLALLFSAAIGDRRLGVPWWRRLGRKARPLAAVVVQP